MTCESCDECTAYSRLHCDELYKLCDRTPATWTAEDIQRAKDKADWIGYVIDAYSTPDGEIQFRNNPYVPSDYVKRLEKTECPTTSLEDSDHHTKNKKSF